MRFASLTGILQRELRRMRWTNVNRINGKRTLARPRWSTFAPV